MGIEADRLGVDRDARHLADLLRPAGQGCLVEIAPGEKRQGEPAADVVLDVGPGNLGRGAENLGELADQGLGIVEGARERTGTAQLFEVDGQAVARAVVGQRLPVPVIDPPAQTGQAHTAYALALEILAELRSPGHLNTPQREAQKRKRSHHQRDNDADADRIIHQQAPVHASALLSTFPTSRSSPAIIRNTRGTTSIPSNRDPMHLSATQPGEGSM